MKSLKLFISSLFVIAILNTQINAAYEIGIKTPFYFAIGWSVLDAQMHPEWIIKNKNGADIDNDLEVEKHHLAKIKFFMESCNVIITI